MEEKVKLLILYASQTGNASDAAERLGREAERRGCPVAVLSIDEFDYSSLPYKDTIIFVVSTTGQGDTPDSMKAFWMFLLQRSLGQHWLNGVQYAVFGLGDSGYQKYNFVAKKLDKRLSDLGATPVIERGLGDDQHPSGVSNEKGSWLARTVRLRVRYPGETLSGRGVPGHPQISRWTSPWFSSRRISRSRNVGGGYLGFLSKKMKRVLGLVVGWSYLLLLLLQRVKRKPSS